MKILVINPKIPYPVWEGDSLRIYHLYARLASWNEVSLLFPYSTENEMKYLSQLKDSFSEIYCVKMEDTNHNSLPVKLLNYVTSGPSYLLRKKNPHFFHEFKRKLVTVLRDKNIQIIHVHTLEMAEFTNRLRGIPRLLDIADSSSLAYARKANFYGKDFSLRTLLRYLNYKKLKRFEKLSIESHNVCTSVSPIDAAAMKALALAANIHVIPNGVDTAFFAPLPVEEESPSVVFSGVMNFLPNMDAVLHFFREILPLVRQKIPALRFYIVGRSPTQEIKNLGQYNNIIVTGFVKDIRKWICKANVVVCPMRIGSGIKNKILEAMALGKPVVTTSIGSEALDVRPDIDIFIADTPKDFAHKIVKLIQDIGLRKYIGNNARRRVTNLYSWDVTAKKYQQLFERLSCGRG